jgi:hypothetical protein
MLDRENMDLAGYRIWPTRVVSQSFVDVFSEPALLPTPARSRSFATLRMTIFLRLTTHGAMPRPGAMAGRGYFGLKVSLLKELRELLGRGTRLTN